MDKTYRVGDLRRIVKESANEFKPVVGNKDNKKINGEAYSTIKKETEKYDGGLSKKKTTPVTPDSNQGMSDIRYDNVSDSFKERAVAQLKGYPSKKAEELHKNDEFGNAVFTEPKWAEKHAKDSKDIKDNIKLQGLTGRTQTKKDVSDENSDIFESKMIDKLNFKNTKFLSENHMLSKVPDNYKFDGSKFIMNDSDGTSYIVEWRNDDKPIVEKKISKKLVKEELNRIKSLFDYRSSDKNKISTYESRLEEERDFSSVLDKARGLSK